VQLAWARQDEKERRAWPRKAREGSDQLPVLPSGCSRNRCRRQRAVCGGHDPPPVRSFPTFTRDLNALADFLQQCGIHSVAMEVHQRVLDSGVSNPRIPRVGSVPCQRTAREERSGPEDRRLRLSMAAVPPLGGLVARLAHVLRHGMIRPSFIPERAVRELRGLTRRRRQLVGERSRERSPSHTSRVGVALRRLAGDVVRRLEPVPAVLLGDGGEAPTAPRNARGAHKG
jgi:hypothetical protein